MVVPPPRAMCPELRCARAHSATTQRAVDPDRATKATQGNPRGSPGQKRALLEGPVRRQLPSAFMVRDQGFQQSTWYCPVAPNVDLHAGGEPMVNRRRLVGNRLRLRETDGG